MSWPRDVTVTIAGTDYTSDVLDGVFVQRGRQTYFDNPSASVCEATLLAPTTIPDVGDEITVTVDLQAGTQTVFRGFIQDVDGRFDVNIGAYQQILAFGPLARVGRRDQTTDPGVQLDGVRVKTLVTNALAEQWAEQPLTQQWGQVDAAKTWADYAPDGTNFENGIYDVAAISSLPTNALNAAGIAAFSGGGVLYETSDGQAAYVDSTHRPQSVAAGPLVIEAADIEARSIQSTISRSNLVNLARVTYDGGTVDYIGTDSRAEYGYAERDYTTILNDVADATELAERLVVTQAFPAPELIGPTNVPLDALDETLTDQLLGLEVNDYIKLESLPTAILGTDVFYGFLEGVTFDLTPNTADCLLYLSDAKFSIYDTRWADVFPALTWGGVDATLEWQNA